MARVRNIAADELPTELAAIYREFSGAYGPFANQVAVLAHVPAALRHLMPLLMELRAAKTRHRRRAGEPRVGRPIRKRPIPVQRLAERGGQAVACEREVHLHACGARSRAAERRRVGHLRDRCNAGDRFFGEAAERVRDSPDQLAVDVHRAPAHPGDDAGMGQRPAFELRENEVPVRPDDVLEHADDVDLEFFNARAVEDRPPDADHAWADFIDAHLSAGAGKQRGKTGNCRNQDKDGPAD